MALETYANLAQSTLNGAIIAGDTSIVLTDASAFPSTGDFRILIDTEIIRCTSRSSNTLTVVRAQESTSAASHSNGATVTQILTRGGLIGVGTNLHRTDTYANIPAAGTEGRLFLPTDGFHVLRDDGSAWSAWGPVMPMTPVVDASYAWVNQGSATLSVTSGGAVLVAPTGTGDNVRARVKTLPSAPYTITLAFIPTFVSANFLQCGIVLRDSVGGKLVTLCLQHTANAFVVSKWNSATSFNADYTPSPSPFAATPFLVGPCLWLQINDDNSNRICRVSADGKNFHQIHSVGRTDFVTPDQWGFYAATNNASFTATINVLSAKET